MVIVAIPLFILKFLGERNWKFRRIDKNVLKEKNRQDWKGATRLIGFILILMVFGVSILPSGETFTDFSIWFRILIAIIGAVMIAISNKTSEKDIK